MNNVDVWEPGVHLLDSVEHFPLHAVLKLAPPQHQMEDFVDGVLWILLEKDTERGQNIKTKMTTDRLIQLKL